MLVITKIVLLQLTQAGREEGGMMVELYHSMLVGLSIVVRCLTASVNDI